jgi:TolB protein
MTDAAPIRKLNCRRTGPAYDRVMRSLLVGAALAAMLLSSVAAAAPGAKSGNDSFPGGNGQIVFSSLAVKNGPYDLYLMRPDGTKRRRITRGRAWERYPSWSPDGKWLAYISDRSKPGNERAYEIYVIRPNGTGLRRVTHDRWIDDQLAWSPNGKQLIFSSYRASRTYGLAVINLNGTGFRRLTRGLEEMPAWSPDGKTIAYVRHNFGAGPSGITEIWLMNPDGSNRRQLTFPPEEHPDRGPASDSMPAWSPDGSQIAFARTYPGQGDVHRANRTYLYVIGADGTGTRQLTSASGNSWPEWSPNGKRIAFVSVRRGKAAIYTMDANGSDEKRLTTGGIDYVYPDWQPLPRR